MAAAGLTAMAVEVAGLRLRERLGLRLVVAVNRMVILVATLCDKLVKVTRPLAAARAVVPCKVPAPALRAAVTIVVLSAVPLAALRALPNWSRTWMTGCCAKATPAAAAGEGCV